MALQREANSRDPDALYAAIIEARERTDVPQAVAFEVECPRQPSVG